MLGIEHILARTPEVRGRSERCFGTRQGRLPPVRLLVSSSTSGDHELVDGTLAFSFHPRL